MSTKIKEYLVWILTVGGLLTLIWHYFMKIKTTYNKGRATEIKDELGDILTRKEEAKLLADELEKDYDEEAAEFDRLLSEYYNDDGRGNS